MRNVFVFVVLQAILISSCSPQSAPETDQPGITLTDCVLSSPGVDTQVDAKCGSLAVSEDPSDPQSRQIRLNVAIVPAIKRSPEPDPLVVLAGGPGQSALEVFPAINSTLFRIHEKRDILLVDQRGTGESNPLRCLDPEEDKALDDEQAIALLRECPKKLEADLRYYTTDIAMQDLDRVRSSLGYESINLFGVSYGTRAALTYLKMYPEHVRSVILDAVVDPAFVLYMDAARDGQAALDLFFARCDADEACKSTFPSLKSEFDAVLQKLDAAPVEVTISHPVSGQPLELKVTRRTFTNIIFNTLYSPDLVAMLPLAIHQAYAEENYAALISQAYLLDAGIYDGMFYAVACTEDAPLLSTPDDSADSLFEENAQAFVEVCKAWPHGDPPEVVHAAVDSDVPVLMLSGEADPITPPWHAEHLAQSLSNSLHLVFNDMGHGNSSSGCTVKILDSFVESASVNGLETTCTDSVEPPPFFVDFSGPQP
jgi:pimeloyl-ACP methyl ester carboxylesterase